MADIFSENSRDSSTPNADDYDVSSGCENYRPAGRYTTLDMSNYMSCDSCVHMKNNICSFTR